MLQKFTSDYQRKKFYTLHCHLVNPIEIVLRSSPQLRQGRKGQLSKTGCYIPFVDALVSLLEIPELRHYVDNPHQSHNNFMYDVIDVEYL